MTEEKVNKLKDRQTEIIQFEDQRETRLKKKASRKYRIMTKDLTYMELDCQMGR